IFSTPLICCSIGVTTVEATTSALAPGYCPVTLITGGAISGYCAIGRRENDTPPTITKTIETTAAKIGRSMKKCEMRIALPARSVGLGLRAARRGRHRLIVGRHLLSLTHAHQAVDDDAIVGRQAVLDHAQLVDDRTERHEALLGDIILVDYIDKLAHLLGADGSFGDHEGLVGRRAWHLHACEQSGLEQAVGIDELRATADRAGR